MVRRAAAIGVLVVVYWLWSVVARVHPSFGSRESGRRSKASCQGFAACRRARSMVLVCARVRALDRATRRPRISYRMRWGG